MYSILGRQAEFDQKATVELELQNRGVRSWHRPVELERRNGALGVVLDSEVTKLDEIEVCCHRARGAPELVRTPMWRSEFRAGIRVGNSDDRVAT